MSLLLHVMLKSYEQYYLKSTVPYLDYRNCKPLLLFIYFPGNSVPDKEQEKHISDFYSYLSGVKISLKLIVCEECNTML